MSSNARKIHSSHIGAEGCLRRAREVLFWPGMTAEIKEYISSCDTCNAYRKDQPKEPLVSQPVPDRPWSRVAVDLFTLDKKDYIVIYLLSFVETPRKFIIAEFSIRKLGSSSVLIILALVLLALMKIRAYGSKALQ